MSLFLFTKRTLKSLIFQQRELYRLAFVKLYKMLLNAVFSCPQVRPLGDKLLH